MARAYEEDRPLPRTGFRVAASVMDFFGIVGSTLLILAMMALMTSLFSWLRGDLSSTFFNIGQNISEAVAIEGDANK